MLLSEDCMITDIIVMIIKERLNIIVDIAFISGVKPNLMDEYISMGKVEVPVGIKKYDNTKLSKEIIKAKNPPANIAGNIMGSVTIMKVVHSLAPRLWDAS